MRAIPYHAKTVALAACILAFLVGCAGGCESVSRRMTIVFHAALSEPTRQSKQHFCTFTADIINGTDNHLKAAVLDLSDRKLDVPEVPANAKSLEHFAEWTVSIPFDAPSCEQVVRNLNTMIENRKIGVLTCTMDGVKEGDCQKLFDFKHNFDYAQLQRDDKVAAEISARLDPAPIRIKDQCLQQYNGSETECSCLVKELSSEHDEKGLEAIASDQNDLQSSVAGASKSCNVGAAARAGGSTQTQQQ